MQEQRRHRKTRQALPLPYWTIAWTHDGLSPTQYLGVLRELPPAEERRAGDWCEVTHEDIEDMWILVVVDPRESPWESALNGAEGDKTAPRGRAFEGAALVAGSPQGRPGRSVRPLERV